jgi:hypothetical protein
MHHAGLNITPGGKGSGYDAFSKESLEVQTFQNIPVQD